MATTKLAQRSRLLRVGAALAIATLLTAADCKNGVGGPPPCVDDTECEPTCEAACGSDPVLCASCDDFLRACVCDCHTMHADGGTDSGA